MLDSIGSFLGTGLSSIGSALNSPFGQASGSLGGDFITGSIGHYFGKKSAKYNRKQQSEMSAHMANYMAALQKNYNKWLIPYQNESNLEYQLRYASNRPQAEVSGLRSAGLNPILAAGGGFHSGSMPGASSSSIPSSPSYSSGYTPSRGKGNKLYDPMLAKQLDLMDAEIEGQKIRNENEKANRGLDGKWGAISRLISEGQNRLPSAFEYIKNSPHLTIEKKANANIESFTDDERKALILHDILQSQGYNDVEARHEGGEDFWEHLESAWAKRRRNVRATRKP